MAFDGSKKSQIRQGLKDTAKAQPASSAQGQAEGFGEYERTKNFQFTLQPSVREKITSLAKERGYRSASSFLNDFFKNF
ncbi:hypothetical protein [Streptococcus sobrinus]|uniref:hypothetical protein n=1 Tax=Streptococcus sobrinus TaxID=1310 RepID=UPI0002E31950|nr:hypothetical protein [Streptococcus sobrinus]